MVEIVPAQTDEHLQQVRAMFNELVEYYRTGIDAHVPDLNDVPGMTGYEAEFETLPGIYGPPEGRLLIALDNGEVVGCGCFKKFANGVCELKRLWVRPAARGSGCGKALVEALIQEARQVDYQTMLLETEISLKTAQAIYAAAGFTRTEPYFDGPEEIQQRSVFMRLDL